MQHAEAKLVLDYLNGHMGVPSSNPPAAKTKHGMLETLWWGFNEKTVDWKSILQHRRLCDYIIQLWSKRFEIPTRHTTVENKLKYILNFRTISCCHRTSCHFHMCGFAHAHRNESLLAKGQAVQKRLEERMGELGRQTPKALCLQQAVQTVHVCPTNRRLLPVPPSLANARALPPPVRTNDGSRHIKHIEQPFAELPLESLRATTAVLLSPSPVAGLVPRGSSADLLPHGLLPLPPSSVELPRKETSVDLPPHAFLKFPPGLPLPEGASVDCTERALLPSALLD